MNAAPAGPAIAVPSVVNGAGTATAVKPAEALAALDALPPVRTDDPAVDLPRRVGVGALAPNTGVVAASWNAGEAPFVVVPTWQPSVGWARGWVRRPDELAQTRDVLLDVPG